MKIKTALPKGDANGLPAIEAQALKNQKPIVAIVILEPAEVNQDLHTKEKSLTTTIRRIEPLLQEDVQTATRLLQRSFEARTGETTLPIELEDDITDALKGVDTYVPATETVEETVIDVPEGGYSKMTIPLLRALLKRRGLDHSAGTKLELVGRLETADADPDGATTPANVVSIFNDGSSPVADADDVAWDDAGPHAAEDEDFNPDEYTASDEDDIDITAGGILEPRDVDADEDA